MTPICCKDVMDISVCVDDLNKSYQSLAALKDVSLDVKSGELFGIIGPDGAGKTTLFRILATLLLPDSGAVSICGLDVVKDYRKIRNFIGYMPGRFSLYQDLSVIENLKFFASVFNTSIEENMAMIQDIWEQIAPFKDRTAGKLSGGMKQKLALCCALIHQPGVLILDEPTTGVDAVSRQELWEILKGLKSRGITIIVATPYMDEAVLCDRVALMQQGSILQIDTPQGIMDGYAKTLYSINNGDIYNMMLDLRRYPYTFSVFPFGQSLHYTDKRNYFDESEIVKYLCSKGHMDAEIKRIEAGIEDCFMAFSQEI